MAEIGGIDLNSIKLPGDVGKAFGVMSKDAETRQKKTEELDASYAKELESGIEKRHAVTEAAKQPGGFLNPPDLNPYTPPVPTDPWAVWGSPAMWMAGLSGFMGRRSAAKSLQAASGVMEAFNKKDHRAADEAFKAWKQETANTIQQHEWQSDIYKAALAGAKDDEATKLAIYKTNAHALADGPMQEAVKIGLKEAEHLQDQRNQFAREMMSHAPQVEAMTLYKQGEIIMGHEKEAKAALAQAMASGDQQKIAQAQQKMDAVTAEGTEHAERMNAFAEAQGASRGKAPEPGAGDGTDIPVGGKGTKVLRDPNTRDAYAIDEKAGKAWKQTEAGGWEPISIKELPTRLDKLTGSGAQGAREAVFNQRMLISAREAAADLENVVKLPIAADTGWLGGRKQGPGLMDATREVLANKMTDQDVQSYNVMAAGFQRSLATIEAAGLMPSGSLTHQMDSVIFKAGDTNLTKLQKLAQTRQIVESGLDVIATNPRLSDAEKDGAIKTIEKIKKAVPFTQGDLIRLQAEQTKNPEATLSSMFPNAGKRSGAHSVGDIIEHGGKQYRVIGGSPDDPDIEPVEK